MVDAGWPRTGLESLPWGPSTGAVGLTRRERAAAAKDRYDAALVPEIAHLDPRLSREAEVESEDAVTEVARFDARMGHEVLPFAGVLLRGESIASSDIEHITSSARNIALAEATGGVGGNAALVARNVHAMVRAIDRTTGVDRDGILSLHAELMEGDPRHAAGVLRQEPVWIGGFASTPVGAHFVAPHHSRVPAALDDLLRFSRRPDLPRISQLAIAHAQFETIHPFTDGNGRVGRALMHVMLRESGLVQQGLVPISAGLLTDTSSYHRALDAYREGEPEPIVRLFTTSALLAVSNGTRLVETVRTIRLSWDDRLRVRRGANAWRVADLLLRRPLLTARLLESELGLSPTHAPRVMAPLLDAGIVRAGRHHSSRAAYWWSPELTDAVDDFAVRAGRRRL
ncbi:hypothetical protein SGUI_0700 [Serinicoccus hydrothermalis]|uniref:Fido domain-containing protein n=1 Tax=Serinicoccus hydrothermalis TaxID=1758689 RepID=A0A1B1N9J5_9MICO|nr:Fic family protein [Serinicoccus hydrothermalis]ANS78096.1 hypothetical protein SGUI_0700 [Serinicoccus hydrothermalis]